MAERPFQPVPNTPLVADPTGDAIWKRWLQGLQSFLGRAVRGPGSSTDNAVARWDGTSGTFLNNSGVIIDDSDNVTGAANFTASGIIRSTKTTANIFLANSATTSFQYLNLTNTGGASLFGSEGSVGGEVITNSNPYDTIIRAPSGLAFSVNNGAVMQMRLSGIGLALGDGTSTISIVLDGDGAANAGAFQELKKDSVRTHLFGHESVILGGGSTSNNFMFWAAAATAFKWNLNSSATSTMTLDGTALSVARKIYPGTDAAAAQTAAGIYAGNGAPNNANGSDGDFYLRSDGGVLTTIYQRRAGAWVGIV